MRRASALSLVLWIGLVMGAGCNEEVRVGLSELAVGGPEAKAGVVAAGPEGVLLRVESADAQRLLGFVVPVLKVVDPSWAKRVSGWELVGKVASFSMTVRELEIGLDAQTGVAKLTGLTAVVSIGIPGGAKGVQAQVKAWVNGAIGAYSADPVWSCDSSADRLICLVSVGGSKAAPDVVKADREREPDRDVILDVTLGVPGLVRKAERWLGTVAVWAVLPEEVAAWRELGLTWSGKGDKLVVRVVGEGSDVLQVLGALAAKRGVDVGFPEGNSVVALANVSQLRERAEFIRDLWSNKPGLSLYANPVRWLDDSWQSQLLELASGYAGVAIPGLLDVEDIWGSLVFLFQPTNPAVLEARLAHIFSDKAFVHDQVPVRTGETIHRVLKKAKKKVERMSWYVKDGTYYFASKADTLVAIAEKLSHPKGRAASGKVYRTEGNELMRIEFSPRNFIQGVDVRAQGMGAGMALTMVKNASVKWPEWVYAMAVLEERPGGISELRVELDGVMGWVSQALKDFEPLLNLTAG